MYVFYSFRDVTIKEQKRKLKIRIIHWTWFVAANHDSSDDHHGLSVVRQAQSSHFLKIIGRQKSGPPQPVGDADAPITPPFPMGL